MNDTIGAGCDWVPFDWRSWLHTAQPRTREAGQVGCTNVSVSTNWDFFGVYASQLHYIAGKLVRTLVENQSCNFRFRFLLDIAHIFYPKSGTISIWCLNGAFRVISSGRAALKESAIRILPSLCKPNGFSCYSQRTELWQTNFSRGFCPRIGHFGTICCWKR